MKTRTFVWVGFITGAFALGAAACSGRSITVSNRRDAGTPEKDAARVVGLHDAAAGLGVDHGTPDAARPPSGTGSKADAGPVEPDSGSTGAPDAGPTCRGGSIPCGGRCVDPQNDPANCGGCGPTCGPGSTCSQGRCVPGCSGSTIDCHGRCVDPQNDPTACGACDHACVAGERCSAGQCVPLCSAPSEVCDGQCTDVTSDRNNCGACGTACSVVTVCSDGACKIGCASGMMLCGDACVETSSDPANCGECGHACAVDEYCSDGTCTMCPAGLALCNGQCTDLKTSVSNCGECGFGCPYVYNGSPTCFDGVCGGVCLSNYGTCVNPSLPCSTYLLSDTDNCGRCGNTCKTDEYCNMGVCTACDTGMSGCGWKCVDFENDIFNCGHCGSTCSYIQNGAPSCVAGECAWTCLTDYGDCNGNPVVDGCEVQLNVDRNNCGTCGKACGATELCAQGVCAVCAPGLTLCRNACVDLQSDPDNCSKCGAGCNAASAETNTCQGGKCASPCDSGYLDCNDRIDGCETASGIENCGACGKACSQGQVCAADHCAACAPTNLGSTVPVAFSGSMIGRSDSFKTSCGLLGGQDGAFSFTAPSAATYTFQVAVRSFAHDSMALEVRDGGCNGPVLGCRDGGPPELSLTLAANQTIVVIVEDDKHGEPFTLSIR